MKRSIHETLGSIHGGKTAIKGTDNVQFTKKSRLAHRCERENSLKYYRLKKQSDFQKIFKKGKRGFSPSLTVLYTPSKTMTMGISIGKKHGKSVKRNRIKRLLREAFRATQGEMTGTYSIVLLPKVSDEYSLELYVRHLRWIIRKEKL